MNWRLKTKIIEKYLTQADFANVICSAESVVSKVVRGRRALRAEEQKLWAKALGVEDPATIFPDVENNKKEVTDAEA